jgi:hypothetical protein
MARGLRLQPGYYILPGLAISPLLVESVYSAVIVAICLLIYFKTREIEKLASHKGITYFRLTFFHFAVSYFFKFMTSAMVFSLDFPRGQFVLQFLPTAGTMFISIYASLMAAIYLANSVSWNDEDSPSRHEETFWSVIAMVAAGLTVFMGQSMFYIVCQSFLFVYVAYVLATSKKKSSFVKAIYPALLGFWILSIADIFIPNVYLPLQIGIYLVSTVLFSVVLYKVIRRVG